MREYERTVLLERIDREGATVGTSMPATITHDGEEVAVRDPVMELASGDDLSDGDHARATELKRTLRRRRSELHECIESGDITKREGEELVEVITGIDRALNALDQLGEPSVTEQARQHEKVDQQRWMSFLREALGHDQERGR